MHINRQRLGALIRRETLQLLRDRRFLVLAISMVLVQLFVYGYSVSLSVYHLPMAVVDQSQDARSRELVRALTNSQYFDEALVLRSQAEALQAIDRGAVKVAVIIPPGFAAHLNQGSGNVLFLLDGSDSFAVRAGYSAASLVVQNYGLRLTAAKVARTGAVASGRAGALPIVTSSQVLYNPDLTDMWFVLPGIIGLILQTLAIEQAAIFVVRDRELGMLEQILATPARELELILSKLIPLLVLCLLAFGIVLGLGIFWFGVPFQGSLWLYVWLSLLFIAACLGLGLFISTRTNTQREAETLALLFLMFGLLMSGLFYPRIGQPLLQQIIGDLVPLTYFIRISRGIFTKGVGLEFFWSDALVLATYTVVVIVIAAKRFKMRLD